MVWVQFGKRDRAGVLLLCWTQAFSDRRGVSEEALRHQRSPCLSFLTLRLAPRDRLVIGIEKELDVGDHLDPIAARFVDVEKAGLLNGVLGRTGLDVDSFVQKDVGGPQHKLTVV